ncbi:MAG: hypothetical protein AVDCRST_MAG73-4108 [uncultured Thermomicrobiales bacterium]|uniref:Uncharacterized protein n=1 Tax=uncultured Thermomicrobiales bacterium TaxID=1645740 RepID=A0A6J4V4V3_9BACT|nr:MAG: hypothetical protein AVDCRST_MAG73-4108 [uncultured Thermomicrobiales bacterium]
MDILDEEAHGERIAFGAFAQHGEERVVVGPGRRRRSGCRQELGDFALVEAAEDDRRRRGRRQFQPLQPVPRGGVGDLAGGEDDADVAREIWRKQIRPQLPPLGFVETVDHHDQRRSVVGKLQQIAEQLAKLRRRLRQTAGQMVERGQLLAEVAEGGVLVGEVFGPIDEAVANRPRPCLERPDPVAHEGGLAVARRTGNEENSGVRVVEERVEPRQFGLAAGEEHMAIAHAIVPALQGRGDRRHRPVRGSDVVVGGDVLDGFDVDVPAGGGAGEIGGREGLVGGDRRPRRRRP